MDKIAEALTQAVAKANDYLAETELPWYGKVVAWILLGGLLFVFIVSCISIANIFLKSNGITEVDKVEVVIRTFFNAPVLASIYGLLRLLIDKDGNGIPDEIEKGGE